MADTQSLQISVRGDRRDKAPGVRRLNAVCVLLCWAEQTIAQGVVNNTAGTNKPNPDTPWLLSGLILRALYLPETIMI